MYLEHPLEVQFGRSHGVSGEQLQGALPGLVEHRGVRAVLEKQLRVLAFLQHRCNVQRSIPLYPKYHLLTYKLAEE